MTGLLLVSLVIVECLLVRTPTSFAYQTTTNLFRKSSALRTIGTVSRPATTTSSSSSSSSSDTFSSVTSSSSSSKQNPWESFDYLQHWYPCCWDVDVPVNTPTQVTLFDVNYAIVRHAPDNKNPQDKKDATTTTTNSLVTAVVDQCPHRAALLSEGRVTEAGWLQCAYHGWTFNGTTGACVDIPQAALAAGGTGGTTLSYSQRTGATAIPACIHQGLIWLWPGPVPEGDNALLPTPPTIPELDDPSFGIAGKAVRDFPMIDWTLLLSNILDPDHGLFAHQASSFDWYVASPDHPLEIEESFDNHSWTMISRVPAIHKILLKSQQRREGATAASGSAKTKKRETEQKDNKKKDAPVLYATSTLQAPCTVTLARRDENKRTKGVACFWVCPVGTGRSRFLSLAAFKGSPIKIPRWFQHMALNGFLDQDSVLVASQQPPVLQAEALGQRRSDLFVYQSPTDKAVRRIDQFWDATVAKAPNRQRTLLQQQLWPLQDRTIVLDRKTQHLDICPDSQDAVRNCQRIRNVGVAVSAVWTALSLSTVRPNLPAVVKSVVWPAVALTTAYFAEQIRSSFYYKYTRDKLRKDLSKIPKKTWADLPAKE